MCHIIVTKNNWIEKLVNSELSSKIKWRELLNSYCFWGHSQLLELRVIYYNCSLLILVNLLNDMKAYEPGFIFSILWLTFLNIVLVTVRQSL